VDHYKRIGVDPAKIFAGKSGWPWQVAM